LDHHITALMLPTLRADLAHLRERRRTIFMETGAVASLGRLREIVLRTFRSRPKPHTVSDMSSITTEQKSNVLFLSTGNSARSIMAEAILKRLGAARFHSHSAGSHPRRQVHPEAARLLEALGYDIADLRSKSWDEFAQPEAPALDFVLTLCDNAASETCPVWPGAPVTAHWPIPDPAETSGSPTEIALAFKDAYLMLHRRIGAFTALSLRSLDQLSLQAKLNEIGDVAG
jgi:arsenate reductase (thioredoxin)